MQKHFLSITDLSQNDILTILETAKNFQSGDIQPFLQDKWVANLFFEPSTRTRCSFEMAAKKLGAEVLNLDISRSSLEKGEELLDAAKTLEAMGCHILVMRHSKENQLEGLSKHLSKASVINAGDGKNEHPSQAILDMLTISQQKPDFSKLSVAIVGDILHSRVARSDIFALQTLGVREIRVIAPKELLLLDADNLDLHIYEDLYAGLKDVDVVIVLRVQKERMLNNHNSFNVEKFSNDYCVTERAIREAKPDVMIMHPGPLNRGIEIASNVADSANSVILQQVTNGVWARMAIYEFLSLPVIPAQAFSRR